MSDVPDPVVRRVIDAAGGTAALAQRLGIRAPSIYSWRRVPAPRAIAISKVTNIPLHELRPDLWEPPIPDPAGTKFPTKRAASATVVNTKTTVSDVDQREQDAA